MTDLPQSDTAWAERIGQRFENARAAVVVARDAATAAATADALRCELDRWTIVNPAARKVCERAVLELRRDDGS